jgi:large subunit ribosomal protein L17
MRHRVAGKKLGRSTAHRRALFRNLVTALLDHEAVRTTDAKAKELKRWGDRMITLGKQGTLAARRRAAETLQRPVVLQKLFSELGPRYAARAGGYTRVTKLGPRPGDAAPMSIVELLDRPGSEAATGGKKKPARRRADKGDSKKQAAAGG